MRWSAKASGRRPFEIGIGRARVSALGHNLRLAARVFRDGARRGGRRLGARATFRAPRRAPENLLVAPRDLRTSDPVRASEIYAGTFVFSGARLDFGAESPFLADAPSAVWASSLHGFGWLRHLRAADTTLARANARALVEEWIRLGGRARSVAHSSQVTSRRLISWLSHSPLILDGADRGFHLRFLRSLARQTRVLGRKASSTNDGAPRLLARIALAYAGLCLSGEPRLLRTATKALCEELDRQILADGGHVSRNPAMLVDVLLDLLPLREAYVARDVAPPQALNNAIDRMVPMLRFFRHGDGDFAQFNGAGPTSSDLVAAILAQDDARGAPVDDAAHSGYQRLATAESVAIMDAGAPPPMAVSEQAHAGCLSFELSSGADRIVVNCGAPRFGRPDWVAASRATAAHSTATIEDQSSCRFAADALRRIVGAIVIAGPEAVTVARTRDQRGVTVFASHDGYAAGFGVLHERTLTLSPDGDLLKGSDAFRDANPARITGDPRLALRFHLHPGVRASAREDGSVALTLPSGAGWTFAAPGFSVEIEESVFLASALGPRRSEQIVINATVRGAPEIAWSFERSPVDPSLRPRMPLASTLGA